MISKAVILAPLREAHHRGEYVLGTKFKVYTFDRGTKESMQRQARDLRTNLLKYLNRNYELGRFSVSALQTPDGGYEVFVTYFGEAVSPRQKRYWKAQRRASRPT